MTYPQLWLHGRYECCHLIIIQLRELSCWPSSSSRVQGGTVSLPAFIDGAELLARLLCTAAEQAQGFHRFQCTPGGVRRLAGRLVDCGGVTRPQWQQFFRVLPSTSMMGDYWLTSHCSRVEGCRSEVINVPQVHACEGPTPMPGADFQPLQGRERCHAGPCWQCSC